MINQPDQWDELTVARQLCTIHNQRMQFALEKINRHFPLNSQKYLSLEPEELSFIDQLIFRFSKLQDSMGGKLFPVILETLGEDIQGKPFIDRLTKIEELGIIPSTDEWFLLRETRNLVTHEYPFITDEVIEGLNLLIKHCQLITNIWKQVEIFLQNRFGELRGN